MNIIDACDKAINFTYDKEYLNSLPEDEYNLLVRRSMLLFRQGAQWERDHVWRPPVAIPVNNKHILAEWQLNESEEVSYTVFRFPYDCYPDGKMSWHDVVKEYNIKRWAYIEDLLAL